MDEATILKQLEQDLANLGVKKNSVFMVHCPLETLPEAAPNEETIIKGILSYLGEKGTLLLPSITNKTVTPQNPVFDILNTPSNCGKLAEYFRKRSGTLRSMNPVYPVCALGDLAEDVIDYHHFDATFCGVFSPFSKLKDYSGQLLLLGGGLGNNPFMHAIEELVAPPYLFGEYTNYTLIDENGNSKEKRYQDYDFDGYVLQHENISGLLSGDELKEGQVLGMQSYLIDAEALFEKALETLKLNSLAFADYA